MRMIGHVEGEPAARRFSDFLYVSGIRNQVEADSDGRWAVWIHAEDELDQARALLETFLANPNDASYRQAAQRAEQLRAQEEEEEATSRKRHFDREQLLRGQSLVTAAPLTITLMAISIVVYLVREFTSLRWITDYFFISDPNLFSRDLPEVREGQFWRLVTPIFLHSSYPLHLHIIFNMLWLKDLGSVIESRVGRLTLGLLVLVIAVASNVAQNYVSGPNFLGMSGVVYGLLGYIWLRGKFDPFCGLFLPPSTVMMMLLWLVFGYTNVLPLANTVHTVGLGVGMVWGFIAARARR